MIKNSSHFRSAALSFHQVAKLTLLLFTLSSVNYTWDGIKLWAAISKWCEIKLQSKFMAEFHHFPPSILISIDSEAKDRVGEPKKGVSRNSSKATSRDTSRPPSAIENHIDYFREPVVKSPPEPTRVKSPEQLLMRSPDPINWTVPLDTGKTFQVTQSVRDSGK